MVASFDPIFNRMIKTRKSCFCFFVTDLQINQKYFNEIKKILRKVFLKIFLKQTQKPLTFYAFMRFFYYFFIVSNIQKTNFSKV